MFIRSKVLLSGVIRKSTVAEKDGECTSKTIVKSCSKAKMVIKCSIKGNNVGAMDEKSLQNKIK